MPDARDDETAPLPAWLLGVALVSVVVLVYAPALGNGYVSDDEIYIRGIRELASLAGLRDIWFRIGAIPQYYPLVHTSFWLEYHAWGLDPRRFHAMNLATHAVVVLLIWRVLLRLRVPGAWLAAAIFAVHPVHVESVAWASERKNLYAAAFALGSIAAYLRFAPLDSGRDTRGPAAAYALSLLLFLAALGSKTVTATTPAVLLVLRWWKDGRVSPRDVRPLLPFFALGLPLAALTVWIERVHVGALGPAWALGPLERVLIAGRAVCFYLGKLVWPHPLGFVYPRWIVDAQAPAQWLFPLAVAATAALLWILRHRIGRGPLAALLLFVGILFPALGFFDVYPFLFSYVADHYQYPASVAVIALAAAVFAIAERRAGRRTRHALRAAAVATVALLAVLAHRETYAYRDDATLIRHAAARRPDSWSARYRLGVLLQNENRNEEAIAELREALRLYPDYARLHATIGINLAALGRLGEADAAFERALAGELDADERSRTHFELGKVRSTGRRFAEAAEQFRLAAALAETDASELHYNRGIALRQAGDLPGAIAALRDAVASNANVAAAHYALGMLLTQNGDAAAAVAPLREAVRIAPSSGSHREGLAAALLQTGDVAQAEAELRAAIAREPSAGAHNLLGIALARKPDRPGAIEQFRAALRIDPQHPGATANLQHMLDAER